MSKFNAIDLFCGAGGLSLGFQQAGFNIIVGVDNEPAALDLGEQEMNTGFILIVHLKKINCCFNQMIF